MCSFYNAYLKNITYLYLIICNQDYVEVEPSFVHKHFNKLKDPWNALNENEQSQLVKFNLSYINPNLTEGWSDLKEFHGFPENVEVVFGYYGHNLFRVVMLLTDPTTIPNFHSCSLKSNQTTYFDIRVWEYSFKNPFLVKIYMFKFLIFFSHEPV